MTESGVRPTALIFDLDDTLIDTTGQLLGPAHTEAAAAMIAAGLTGSIDEVAQARTTFARSHPGEDLERLVIECFGAGDPEAAAAAGKRAFYERSITRLDPLPEALPVLADLRARNCSLFLVTLGHPATQRQKVKLAELEGCFDVVRYVDVAGDTSKEQVIAALMTEQQLSGAQTVVIGDRIDREIAAGRRLGCWTVRVERGEGQYFLPREAAEQAHYTVGNLEAIPSVLVDIEAAEAGPDAALARVP
ncbi:MAG: HAD family hydrolase [Myxococcota bacterium]|nr:HAD family hydrolase [Myxococcota bacterium]